MLGIEDSKRQSTDSIMEKGSNFDDAFAQTSNISNSNLGPLQNNKSGTNCNFVLILNIVLILKFSPTSEDQLNTSSE
jgi:hypothetical protein